MFRSMNIYLCIVFLFGCGNGAAPLKIEGQYVQITGAINKTFLIAENTSELVCKPKPGLSEFEYSVKTAESDYFHVVLRGYNDANIYQVEYVAKAPSEQHTFDIQLADGSKYKFFEAFRGDTSEIYRSFCTMTIEAIEGESSTRYDSTLCCSQLWADPPSYSGTSVLNNFINLNAMFSCEY